MIYPFVGTEYGMWPNGTRRQARIVLRIVGDPFDTNFENTLKDFVTSENLKLGQTYFLGSSGKKGPFMVVSEASI